MKHRIPPVVREALESLPEGRRRLEEQLIRSLDLKVSLSSADVPRNYLILSKRIYKGGATLVAEHLLRKGLNKPGLGGRLRLRFTTYLAWILVLQAKYGEARNLFVSRDSGKPERLTPPELLILSFIEIRAQNLEAAQTFLDQARRRLKSHSTFESVSYLVSAYLAIEKGIWKTGNRALKSCSKKLDEVKKGSWRLFLRAMIDYLGAILSFYGGRFREACSHVDSFTRCAEALHDPYLLAESKNLKGAILAEIGEYQEAESYQLEAISQEKKLLSEEECINSYFHLGELKYALGAFKEALDYFTLCHESATGLGLRRAGPYWGIGACNIAMGNLSDASDISERGLRIAEETGRYFWYSRILYNIAEVKYRMRDASSLKKICRKMNRLLRRISSPEIEIFCHRVAHLLYSLMKDDLLAEKNMLSLARSTEGVENPAKRIYYLLEAADAYFDISRLDIADTLLKTAEPQLEELSALLPENIRFSPSRANYHLLKGKLLYRRGELSASENHLRRSLAYFGRSPSVITDSARAREALAANLMQTGRLDEAESLLQEARQIYYSRENRVPTSFWPLLERLAQLRATLVRQNPRGGSEVVTVELHDGTKMIAGPRMREVLSLARQYSRSVRPILLLGESGVGKELLARFIHTVSRPEKPFEAISIYAEKGTMFLDDVFGHVKGAFTGAVSERAGLVEIVNAGTLFLDEIHNCPPEYQAALLRFLREGEYKRLGSNQTKKAKCRIVSATNQSPESLREDFAVRINVLTIRIPPLRERREEIPYLAEFFLEEHRRQSNQQVLITPKAISLLCGYRWPLNVAQLGNTLERAALVSDGTIDADLIQQSIEENDITLKASGSENQFDRLREVERVHIETVLRSVPSTTAVAKILGISRSTLYGKMKRLGIDPREL